MVMLEENDNDVESHIQLRNKFLEEISDTQDEYDPDDVDRVKHDDYYCKRFILHKKGNFDEAYAMMKEALAWRKSFGCKDCTEDSIPIEFFEAKGVFPFYYDKAGNPNIMILVRYHKKNAEFAKDIRRFVIYWVEKMENDYEGKQMTVVMSCTGAGLSNLDLDLIKFLITLFRSYYPHSLAHILIFEMPWIFNAAWKIIKSWLPEDFVEKIVFVNKTTITNFIEADNLPLEMGGTREDSEPIQENGDTASVGGNSISENSIVNTSSVPKRVHFSSGEGMARHENSGMSSKNHVSMRHRENSSDLLLFSDHAILAGMLKISPPQDLMFQPPGSELQSDEVTIHLANVCEKTVTFKVKTNNINSYRVKPATGIIEPGESIDIGVNLIRDKRPHASDKFLIMAMELPNSKISMSSLNHMWRTTRTNVVEHKLRCVLVQNELTPHEMKVDQTLKSISDAIARISLKVESLEKDQRKNINHHRFTIFLLIFFGILLWSHIIFDYSGGLLFLH